MASEYEFRDAESMLAGVRQARLDIFHTRNELISPGEMSSLARLTFVQVPELCRRMGIEIAPGEGHPPGITVTDDSLVRMLASDMQGARPIATWIAPHVPPETQALFARGGGNAFDGILERFASERGFVRDDVLSREARGEPDGAGRLPAAVAAIASSLDRGR